MTKLLLFAALLLVTVSGTAQQRTIRGRVIDARDKTPMPVVRIIAEGQSTTALTDPSGQFTMSLPKKALTLTALWIGYVTKSVRLKPLQESVLIEMVADTTPLYEEVISAAETSASFAPSRSTLSPTVSGRSRSATPARGAHYLTAATKSGSSVNIVGSPSYQAGQLTAGEIHDYSKWTLWGDIAQKELRDYRSLWRMAPAERYSVQVVSANGFPLIDVPVRLFDNQRQLIWETRTDNTGRGELWANLFGSADSTVNRVKGKVRAEAVVEGKTYALNRLNLFGKGDNTLTVDQPCGGAAQTVDVAFVVDATGSMGDEISYLKAELTDVINRAKQAAPNSTIRLGSVFYRDHAEAYLTRHHDFATQPDSAVAFIKKQNASGGGDYPEAVDTALAVALTKLSWSPAAKTRLLFLVLDAPPHDDAASIASLQRSVAKAAAMGIRLIPVAASGIDKSTEYLLRSMALGTNGTYVFLADDSGIGNPHIKPTTDQYTVEKLNALLVRLIAKFTQTTDCQPPTVANVPTGAPQVRYTEQGQPVDSTAAPTFRYFPNPTRDYLTIENAAPINELFVMDITGKVLMRETPNRPVARLDMQAYPTGTYLFRFSATQIWQAGRFIRIQ